MRISDWSSDVCSSDLKGRSCCHPPHCNVDRADIPLPARRLAAIVASHVTENEVSTTTADHVVALVLAGNNAQIAIDHIVATLVLVRVELDQRARHAGVEHNVLLREIAQRRTLRQPLPTAPPPQHPQPNPGT